MNDSKFFEDVKEGEVFKSSRRTITETDLISFLNLMRLNNPLFADQQCADDSSFHARVVPGPLTLGIAISLVDNLGLFWSTLVALISLETNFLSSVQVGDTIKVESLVEKRKEGTKPGRGHISLKETVINQNDKPVMILRRELLVKRKMT